MSTNENSQNRFMNLCDWNFSDANDVNLCNLGLGNNQNQSLNNLQSKVQNPNTIDDPKQEPDKTPKEDHGNLIGSSAKNKKNSQANKIEMPQDNDAEPNNKEKQVIQNIKELGTDKVPTKEDKTIQCITIIGEIEGHFMGNPQKKATKYEHIIPLLYSIEEDPEIKGILIILNTVGGDVEAGLAMAELINSISKKVVTLVLGGSHSIGVPLATAGDYSFIAPSATMIVHPVRTNGLVIGVNETFEYFKKMQERINDFIIRTSDITAEELTKLMHARDDLVSDVGSVLIGKEAVDCGLINEVGGLKESLTKLKELIKEDNN
ncbi:ATP-dependent Clp protease proteolytic subunit [Intestinibacter bartlettii]|uniref:ClpP family protease n=1 Tax=Intestinibacter bartlettii TaxID=261299 RepID=UPI002ED5518E